VLPRLPNWILKGPATKARKGKRSGKQEKGEKIVKREGN